VRWLLLGLGVVSFLVAAKAHGRQLRLERELAGYWQVTFVAPNAPFVEALWRGERFLYWSIAAALALVSIAYRLLAPARRWPLPLPTPPGERSYIGLLLLHVWLPLVAAFVVTGLYRLVRLLRALDRPAPDASPGWWSGALWGSAAWWALTVVLSIALVVLAWRRPA
jgi:hypothetical protein